MTIKDLKEVRPSRSEIAIRIYKISQPIQSGNGCGENVYVSTDCYNYSSELLERKKYPLEIGTTKDDFDQANNCK